MFSHNKTRFFSVLLWGLLVDYTGGAIDHKSPKHYMEKKGFGNLFSI